MISIKRRSVGDIIANVVIYILLTLIAVIMVIPFIYVIAASFATEAEIQTRPIFFIPDSPTLDAYARIFDMNDMGTRVFHSLLISVCVTAIGTFINLFFTTTMAYGLSRTNLIGKKPLLNMVLFTMVFGGGMIPLFLVVKGLGMYLPRELEEAASIDGCSDIGIFIKIALPLSLPCLATFGLFYAVGHWNNYFGALLYLEDSTKFPFQLVLRNIVMQTAETQTDPNALIPEDTLKMAVIVIGTVPILIVYPFLQKHFAAGVMVGAVKG